jgi:hypothetical protein
MKKTFSTLALAAVAAVGGLCSAGPVAAQVAGGTTTVEASVTESTELAMGWSVNKTQIDREGPGLNPISPRVVRLDKSEWDLT